MFTPGGYCNQGLLLRLSSNRPYHIGPDLPGAVCEGFLCSFRKSSKVLQPRRSDEPSSEPIVQVLGRPRAKLVHIVHQKKVDPLAMRLLPGTFLGYGERNSRIIAHFCDSAQGSRRSYHSLQHHFWVEASTSLVPSSKQNVNQNLPTSATSLWTSNTKQAPRHRTTGVRTQRSHPPFQPYTTAEPTKQAEQAPRADRSSSTATKGIPPKRKPDPWTRIRPENKGVSYGHQSPQSLLCPAASEHHGQPADERGRRASERACAASESASAPAAAGGLLADAMAIPTKSEGAMIGSLNWSHPESRGRP
ncbi:hypothetical protein BKA81DRAFT_137198 [Phyllosticta paracitricarpa]|uniref:Uncharacterized protein n=1 Tax=Phyllosticta paracitricarpa TaxID=2016321 RepID=A0ABR1MXZ4_9PEZI